MKTKQIFETFDLERVSALRDELQLKAHLFDAELQSQWEKLERDWALILSEVKLLAPEAKRTLYRSACSTGRLLEKVERSLGRIREGLDRHHQAVS